jgi:transposase
MSPVPILGMGCPVTRICLTPAQRWELLDHYRRPVGARCPTSVPHSAALGGRLPVGDYHRRPVRLDDDHPPVEGPLRGRRGGRRLRPAPRTETLGRSPGGVAGGPVGADVLPDRLPVRPQPVECEAAAVVLREDFGVPVGRETVRRWLRGAGLVWRRPRPVIRPKDPDRQAKLRALRQLLGSLPADETAVFMDEVDVNLNPTIGCPWMLRGEQAAVETPGTNVKRYLAGSIHGRTGRVIRTEGRPKEGRGAALFVRHLDDLRRAFRHDRVLHVIGDNARFHKPQTSKRVREYLAAWSGRVVLHDLPTSSPECNPVERVWWRLHEAVTRNHRCQTIEELLDLTFDWFATRTHFRVDTAEYRKIPEN